MKKLVCSLLSVVFFMACQKNQDQGLRLSSPQGQNILGGFQVLPSDPLAKNVVWLRIYDVDDINEARPDKFKACTGIVISKKHVLTAAHCFEARQVGKIRVVEVHFTTNTMEDDSLHRINYAEKIRFHEDYAVKQQNHFDMAIVKMDQEIPEFYKPVLILPAAVELAAGDRVTILGYGLKSDYPRIDSLSLNKVTGVPVKEDQSTLIVLDQTSGKGICSGDSGGPTFYEYQGKFYLLGINQSVSGVEPKTKYNCRGLGFIVKAQTFKPWILKAISEF